MNLWRHKAIEHGKATSDEILLYGLTEQNYDMEKSVKRLVMAAKENNDKLENVLKAVTNEDLSILIIADSLANIIIDNLKLNRKVNDIEKAKSTKSYNGKKPKIPWVGTSLSDQHLEANELEA